VGVAIKNDLEEFPLKYEDLIRCAFREKILQMQSLYMKASTKHTKKGNCAKESGGATIVAVITSLWPLFSPLSLLYFVFFKKRLSYLPFLPNDVICYVRFMQRKRSKGFLSFQTCRDILNITAGIRRT